MHIREVEAIPVCMGIAPLETDLGLAPYVSNYDSIESVDRILVRVETSTGVVGWGEMLAGLKSHQVTRSVIEDVVAPELRGVPIDEAQGVLKEFYYPYVRLDPFLGAVSTAIWDLVGKQYGAPIHDLLGGAVKEKVPVAFCLGIMNPEEAGKHAAQAKDAGFTRLKTKAGPNWKADIERLVSMDNAVKGSMEFRLDPNQGWAPSEAVRALTRLEERGVLLEYIEQPLSTETFGSFAKLRSRTNTPIAVNEDTYFRGNLTQLLRLDAIDVAVIDLVPAGGIDAAMDQVGEASAAGVSVSHHCGFDLGIKTAAVLQLVSSTPAIDLPPDSVYYGWDDYVLEDPFELHEGSYIVPTDPGLGVTVDDQKLERYRLDN